MRNAIFLTVVLLLGVMFSSPAKATATVPICNPFAPGVGNCVGKFCGEFGATHIDADKLNIIACMATKPSLGTTPACDVAGADPGCVWKLMGMRKTPAREERVPNLNDWHLDCQNAAYNVINCASACSRYCHDGCNSGISRCSSFVSASQGFNGGIFVGWDTAVDKGICACYN